MDSLKFFRWLYGDFLALKFVGLALGAASVVGGLAQAFGKKKTPKGPWAPARGYLDEANQTWQEANALNQGYANQLGSLAGTDAAAMYNQGKALDWQPYLQASQQAGDIYSGLGPLATQYGDQISGMGDAALAQSQNMFGAGNQMWQTALDPQNLLRARLMNDVEQQSRAASTARGLGMSPYAAGLESQALSNFDIDWENNMLHRLGLGMSGLNTGTMGGLEAQRAAGQDWTQALGMYQLAPQMMQQGALMPLQARQQMLDYQQQMLGNYGQNILQYQMNPQIAIQQQAVPYMHAGAGATNNQFNAAAINREFDAKQQEAGTNAIFQGIGQMAGAWGGGGGGGGSLADIYSSATPAQWSAAFGYK